MKKYQLEIVPDENPWSPREDDNGTIMVCFHKRYNLGDKTDYKSDNFDSWDELKEQIMKDYKVLMIKPLYLYDHSGITISTSSFGCNFDSGQVGWIFVDETKFKKLCGEGTYTNEEIEQWIDSEVKTYDQYITGDVWGYQVYEVVTCDKGHEHKELVDSCFGYYGEEEAKAEGESLMEHYELEVG
jgi:hypothetical protein